MKALNDKILIKIYNRKFTKSSGNYLLTSDSFENVTKNFEAIKEDLNSKELLVLKQTHGIEISDANYPWDIGNEPEADGLITSIKQRTLGIQTADCVPVLVYSEDAKIVGALHCGWKSAIGGIIDSLSEKFRAKTQSKLYAVIGPSISKDSYEVDENYYLNFITKSKNYEKYFTENKNERFQFDLPKFVSDQLILNDIEISKHFDEDTYKNPDIYPSHRYAVHNNLGKYKGSILSTITILK